VTGWAVAAGGDHSAGLKRAMDGFQAWCALGLKLVQWRHQILIADILRMSGQTPNALEYILEAERQDKVKHSGLGIADFHIMKGNLLIAEGHLAEGEATLTQALSRRQSARLFELRAATSLARLWGDRGERAKAWDLLAPIYQGFTEGLETLNLRQAKALLEDLS